MSFEVLIVDDQKDICDLISDTLQEEGYKTRMLTDAHAVVESVRQRCPHLVIMDIWLNDTRFDGIELLDILKQEYPLLPIVMISGHGNIETAVSALKKGAYDFIEKPFKADRLLSIVAKGIEMASLQKEMAALRTQVDVFTPLHGDSTKIVSIRQDVERVAKTNSRVMIQGPAGSGKEVVARLVHKKSHRAQGPFITLNCAAIDPAKFEETLFGCESKGSGSDVSVKLGLLEKADGGTLFLDCVGDVPKIAQGKLVQILQDRSFYRVGGSRPIEVDVRVMSATLPSIKDKIKEGVFREDLYYRLSVVPIDVPPLSERPEDISALATYFLERIAKAESSQACSLTDSAKIALESYHWPGNVRQLKNMMEWVLIMNPKMLENTITRSMLPPEIVEGSGPQIQHLQDTSFYELSLREAREEFERRYLSFHIKRFNGNITKTAATVGMERTALHRKIKLLNIVEGSKESPQDNLHILEAKPSA